MPYTLPTLTEAQTALSLRLNDPGMVRWVAAELTLYLQEAIRTWNAWTDHFRDHGTFATVPGQAFYDIPTEIASLRGMTVTNWDLVTAIQYALIEPPTPAAWTGTDQFTLEQVSTAIQRRRDQFLRDTGSVVTRSETLYAAPPANGRLALSEDVLIIRRAAWRPTATQILRPLTRADEWSANNYNPTWVTSTQAPRAYSVSATPPLFLQLNPTGSTLSGTLDMVSINKGGILVPAVQSFLGVPDDWAWVIKWGALADLLQGDGLALDPQRASYCEQRWTQGIDMARSANGVIGAQIDGIPVRIGSLSDADSYTPLWQLVPAVPRKVLLTGQTLLALTPPPGAVGGPWTIALDVVRNAPIPVNPGDVLQISQDVYDSILDYAQHLAIFKEGPGQLELATALLQRFASAAGVDLRLQQASQPDRVPMLSQVLQDEHAVARELDAVPVE